MNVAQITMMVAGVITAVLLLLVMFVFLRFFRIWIRATLAGAAVPLVRIILMQLRRSDINAIIDCRIQLVQAQVRVSLDDLERAALSGADLEKVTAAMIEADRRGLDFSFEQIVDADRSSRLKELLES